MPDAVRLMDLREGHGWPAKGPAFICGSRAKKVLLEKGRVPPIPNAKAPLKKTGIGIRLYHPKQKVLGAGVCATYLCRCNLPSIARHVRFTYFTYSIVLTLNIKYRHKKAGILK